MSGSVNEDRYGKMRQKADRNGLNYVSIITKTDKTVCLMGTRWMIKTTLLCRSKYRVSISMVDPSYANWGYELEPKSKKAISKLLFS